MKCGQLIEYEMENIFLEKLYTKCGRESILRRFSKKLKLSISLDQYFKVLYGLFLLHANLRAIETTCFYLIKTFSKNKKVLETSLPVSFSS